MVGATTPREVLTASAQMGLSCPLTGISALVSQNSIRIDQDLVIWKNHGLVFRPQVCEIPPAPLEKWRTLVYFTFTMLAF